MRKHMFVLVVCLTLMFLACVNENKHHFYITIRNQSDSNLYLAYEDFYNGKCSLGVIEYLEKNSVFEYRPFLFGFERELGGGATLDFYIVSPDKFNKPTDLYDCDSIPIKNDILEYYSLTLEDLQRMNWTVVYPPEE